MGVLAELVTQMWDVTHGTMAHIEDHDEPHYEWDADGEESDELEGVEHRRSRYKRRKMHRAPKSSRRKDITVWGSYREFAPPVLPTTASAPGFENEVLKLRRKSKRVHRASGEENDDDDEQTTDDELTDVEDDEHVDDVDEHIVADDDDDDATMNAHRHSDHHTRSFPSLRSLNALRSSLPSSFTSFYTPSSLLFGSTTRPATRSTPPSQEINQESVVRRRTPAPQTESGDVGVTGQISESEQARSTMAAKSHLWITLWFVITAPIIAWDVGYCFMRCVANVSSSYARIN